MKKLNIELNVRRMEAQNILTTSTPINPGVHGQDEDRAPERGVAAPAAGNGGVAPVRAGF